MSKINIIASSKPWNRRLPQLLEALTNEKFRLISRPEDLSVDFLSEIKPQFIFFPHWSHNIPARIFDEYQCVIFHMTDLPFGRGGSPLQNLIARGIYSTQISAIKCIENLDAGPVYLKKPLSLYGSAEEIYLRASNIIKEMIVEILVKNIKPIEQFGEPTFFPRRKPDEGNISAANSLDQVFDLIRMLDADGYPSAFIQVGNLSFEFSRASRRSDYIFADVKIRLQEENKD